jgi:hypothetical protein
MRCVAALTILIGLSACGRSGIEALRVNELGEARSAFLSNIAAIQARDTEAYLSHYLQSPDFIQASGPNAVPASRGPIPWSPVILSWCGLHRGWCTASIRTR